MSIATPSVTLSQPVQAATKIRLRRVIGLTTAILIVAGSMIGTGVFKKIVPMAATGLSGNQILLAWLVAGIVTLLGAFTIAGLAKLTTVSGGMYEYMRLALGNFAGFLFGWAGFTIIHSGAIAAVSFVFAQSVNTLIPLPNPLNHWAGISIWNFIYPFENSGIKILAIATIALLVCFNYRGIKNGSGLNNILTSLKIIGILGLIVLGLFLTASRSDTVAFQAISSLHQETIFFTAFFAAALAAFWAYNGFAAVAYITGEVKNPKRNLPIAIVTGVCLVMILYLLVNSAYLNAVLVQKLGGLSKNQIGATIVGETIIGNTGVVLISLLIMLSSLGSLHVGIICHARVYYRMAQERVFFRNATKVHPVFRTPHVSLIYAMVWSMVLVLSGTFDMLTDMCILMIFILNGNTRGYL